MRPQLILIIDAIHIYEATIGVDAIYMVALEIQTSQKELVTWEWWDLWTHEGGFPYIQHVSFCSFSTFSLLYYWAHNMIFWTTLCNIDDRNIWKKKAEYSSRYNTQSLKQEKGGANTQQVKGGPRYQAVSFYNPLALSEWGGEPRTEGEAQQPLWSFTDLLQLISKYHFKTELKKACRIL